MRKNQGWSMPHPEICFIGFISLIISILIVFQLSNVYKLIIYRILAIILVCMFVLLFVLLVISGWNAIVTFDNQGVSQRRWLKKRKWRWEEIQDITYYATKPFRPGYRRFYPKAKLIHVDDKKVVTFLVCPAVQKKFVKLCSNDALRRKFIKLYNESGLWQKIEEN